MKADTIVIAHNVRSAHNVGALLRTADGLAVSKVFLTGYTPYPRLNNDTRLPHEATKLTNQIAKTALGAEKSLNWRYENDPVNVIKTLRTAGYNVFALEQTKSSTSLTTFLPPPKLVLILGNEIHGIDGHLLKICDGELEIPMLGHKESYNVVQAAAMALYHICFYDDIITQVRHKQPG